MALHTILLGANEGHSTHLQGSEQDISLQAGCFIAQLIRKSFLGQKLDKQRKGRIADVMV